MLDEEWISLITEAKRLGLTIEEIREFLQREINKEEFKKAE
ncbi:anti-repressor SinI family protein [Virgibacillus indicus]